MNVRFWSRVSLCSILITLQSARLSAALAGRPTRWDPLPVGGPQSRDASEWSREGGLGRLDGVNDIARSEALARLLDRLEPADVPELLAACEVHTPQVRLAVRGALAADGRFSAGLILALCDRRLAVHAAAVTVFERIVRSLQSRRGLDGLEGEAERRNPRVFPTGTTLSLGARPEGPPSLLGVVLFLRRLGLLDRPLVFDPRAISKVTEARGRLQDGFDDAPADDMLDHLLADHGLERWRLPGMHWVGAVTGKEDESSDGALSDWLRNRGQSSLRSGSDDELSPADRLSLERSILGWCADSLRGPSADGRSPLAVLALASYGMPGLAASAARVLETESSAGPAPADGPPDVICWTLASALAVGDVTAHPERDARRIIGLLASTSPASLRTIVMVALRGLPLEATVPVVIDFLRDETGRRRLDETALVALLRWLADAGDRVVVEPGLRRALAGSFAGTPRIDLELLRLELGQAHSPEDLPDDLVDRCVALTSLPGVGMALARSCPPGLGTVVAKRLSDAGRSECRRIQAALWLLDGHADRAFQDLESWALADMMWFLDRSRPLFLIPGLEQPGRLGAWLGVVADPDAPLSRRLRAGVLWGLGHGGAQDSSASSPLPPEVVALMGEIVAETGNGEVLVPFFKSLASVEAGEVLADALEIALGAGRPPSGLLRALDRVGYLLARDAPGSFFKLRMRLQRSMRVQPEHSPLGKMLRALDEALFAYSSSEDLGRRMVGLEGAGVLFP